MLDTGFAPCYTGYNMSKFTGMALDLKIGDIVIEKDISSQPRYYVVFKIIENDNPIRWGHTYKRFYSVFNLQDEKDIIENVIFRPATDCTYEVIHG